MGLKLVIEFESAVHHGNGYGAAGIIDRTILRDSHGMPYLAGSGIKGKFRSAAAYLMRADGKTACGPPDQQWCKGKTCSLCELFGSPMRAGEAIFCDAYPAERERQVMRDQMESAKSMDDEPRPMLLLGVGVEVRSTTAMSRYWRRAESEHLFSSEVVSRAVRFEGEIGGELKPHQRQTLEDCAALLTHFGGSGARGLGACSFTIEAAKAAGA